MGECRITSDLGYTGYGIEYSDPLYNGNYRRALSEQYDWQETYDNGVFSFNWMWKVCLF